jgi:ubiquinone/menaquinone biosynthesis C-methylase UbiE
MRSNRLLGGRRAALRALRPVVSDLRHGTAPEDRLTLLDVGTGLGDLPWGAQSDARRSGVHLVTVGLDDAPSLLAAGRTRLDTVVCGEARALPFADRSVDIVLCSQLLHHFEHDDAIMLVAELHRVARQRVVVSDLRRSWIAVAGFWAASFPLAFHPVTRHDGVVSVLRGFTRTELADLVAEAVGEQPVMQSHLGFRLTASWSPRMPSTTR